MLDSPPPVPEVIRECPHCGIAEVGYARAEDVPDGAEFRWSESAAGSRVAVRYEDHSCVGEEP